MCKAKSETSYRGPATMLYRWNKIWNDGIFWMKMYAIFASSRSSQLSMLSGGAHSSRRFGAQFVHFHSDKNEHFPQSKRCSLMHTKNGKIQNCWHQLCSHSGIAETKFEHLPRNIRCRRWLQQRFKHWMTSNGPTPLMLCNLEALVNPRHDGLHCQRARLK